MHHPWPEHADDGVNAAKLSPNKQHGEPLSHLLRISVVSAHMVCVLMQRSSTAVTDKLTGWCAKWLGGSEGEALHRAAAQALGLQAQAEGRHFARRVSKLLPAILKALQGPHSVQVCAFARLPAWSPAGTCCACADLPLQHIGLWRHFSTASAALQYS